MKRLRRSYALYWVRIKIKDGDGENVMKEKISELMDGELDHHNIDSVFMEFKKNRELIKDWETYHTISDVVRRPASFQSFDIADKVREQLNHEPVIFVPNVSKVAKHKFYAFAAAASVAILVSSWVLLQVENVQPVTTVAEKPKEKVLVSQSSAPQPTSTFTYTLPSFGHHYFHNQPQPLARKVFLPSGTMYGPVTSEYQFQEVGNSR